RGGLSLGTEPAQERLVGRQALVQHLDRDASTQGGVVGQEDLSRRTAADGRNQAVATAQDATDLVVERHGHAGRLVRHSRDLGYTARDSMHTRRVGGGAVGPESGPMPKRVKAILLLMTAVAFGIFLSL